MTAPPPSHDVEDNVSSSTKQETTEDLIMDSGKGGVHNAVFYPALGILLLGLAAALLAVRRVARVDPQIALSAA